MSALVHTTAQQRKGLRIDQIGKGYGIFRVIHNADGTLNYEEIAVVDSLDEAIVELVKEMKGLNNG